MTLIYHFSREICPKTDIKHWEEIENTGLLMTEKKVHEFADGVDSDLLWFTDDGSYVAGGAANYLLQFLNMFAGQRVKASRKEFELHVRPQFKNRRFRCFVFEAEQIGAERWLNHKNKWVRSSAKRRAYVERIDNNSMQNGDDVASYWVSQTDIDISQAVQVFDVDVDMDSTLARYGFGDCYDFYNWYVACVDHMMGLNVQSDNKVSNYIGRKLPARRVKPMLAAA